VDNPKLVYVGQTTNFLKRKVKHKSNCKTGKKFNFKLYQMIRRHGGWDMFNMIEVEKYPCKDRREAERREEEVRKDLMATMNTNRAFTTEEEKKEREKDYRDDNKDKNQKYYQDNQEKIIEYQKGYREANRDNLQQYRDANKDKKREYGKLYREANKQKISERKKKMRLNTKT
jgi:hypothetical protein